MVVMVVMLVRVVRWGGEIVVYLEEGALVAVMMMVVEGVDVEEIGVVVSRIKDYGVSGGVVGGRWSIRCSDRDEDGGGDGTVNVVYKMEFIQWSTYDAYIWLDEFSVIDLIAYILCRTLVGVHHMAYII